MYDTVTRMDHPSSPLYMTPPFAASRNSGIRAFAPSRKAPFPPNQTASPSMQDPVSQVKGHSTTCYESAPCPDQKRRPSRVYDDGRRNCVAMYYDEVPNFAALQEWELVALEEKPDGTVANDETKRRDSFQTICRSRVNVRPWSWTISDKLEEERLQSFSSAETLVNAPTRKTATQDLRLKFNISAFGSGAGMSCHGAGEKVEEKSQVENVSAITLPDPRALEALVGDEKESGFRDSWSRFGKRLLPYFEHRSGIMRKW